METTQQFGLRNASLAVDQLPLSLGGCCFGVLSSSSTIANADGGDNDDFFFSSVAENWNDGLHSCKRRRSCEMSSVRDNDERRIYSVYYLLMLPQMLLDDYCVARKPKI